MVYILDMQVGVVNKREGDRRGILYHATACLLYDGLLQNRASFAGENVVGIFKIADLCSRKDVIEVFLYRSLSTRCHL